MTPSLPRLLAAGALLVLLAAAPARAITADASIDVTFDLPTQAGIEIETSDSASTSGDAGSQTSAGNGDAAAAIGDAIGSADAESTFSISLINTTSMTQEIEIALDYALASTVTDVAPGDTGFAFSSLSVSGQSLGCAEDFGPGPCFAGGPVPFLFFSVVDSGPTSSGGNELLAILLAAGEEFSVTSVATATAQVLALGEGEVIPLPAPAVLLLGALGVMAGWRRVTA